MRAISRQLGPHGIDWAIADLARRQYGVVSRAQLLELGLSAGGIKRRVASGRLHPIHRGVYLVGHARPLPHGREMAAVLACGLERSCVSHEHAAALWRLLPLPSPSLPINVSVLGTASHDGIRVHRVRSWDRRDRLVKNRIPRTSVARTILDCAATLSEPDLEQLVAKALRDHLVSNAKLADVLERHPRRKGAGALRALLRSRTPAFTRSEAERRMLALVRKAGLPEPITNARFSTYEPDFYWPQQRLIVEVDGYDFHSDRAAFERDRRRDAEMLAIGIRTVRVTWLQLCGEPDDVMRRLAQALGVAAA